MRWFLMVLVLALCVSASSTILFQDSFERADGDVGNGWTAIGPANATIQSGAMRLESSNSMGIYRNFTALTSGIAIVQF